jgi:hypothetical protein
MGKPPKREIKSRLNNVYGLSLSKNGTKLTGQECITKLILGVWEHMDRIWMYRNTIYHENTLQQVAQYKTEALDRRYDEIWVKHTGLV